MHDLMLAMKLRELRRLAKQPDTPPQAESAAKPSAIDQSPASPQATDHPASSSPPQTAADTEAYHAQSPGPHTRLLGLSVYHGDAACAGIVDGQFVTGVEEERFTRLKHWAGFPIRALRHCLNETCGDNLYNLTGIAVARQPRVHFWRKVFLTLSHPLSMAKAVARLKAISKVKRIDKTIADELGVSIEMLPQLHYVEHHLAHIASSFFCSPFEEAMCLTVDGMGDFASSLRAVGRGNRIEPIDRVFYPHSLGIFYTAVTQYLGFPHYGDEYKVMGLAAYGETSLVDKLNELVVPLDDGRFRLDQKYFQHLRQGVSMTWEEGEPFLGTLFSQKLEELLGQPPRHREDELTQWHKDLAASAQYVYEQRFFLLVRSLQRMTKLNKLALAGGCAMNSVANGKIYDNTDVEDVYIQAAAGDAGTSLGAALYVHHAVLNHPRQFVMNHAYWGPKYNEARCRQAIASQIPESGGKDGVYGDFKIETIRDEDRLVRETAQSIGRGDVIGWYQGRSEWGPRALGNRSILADPRRNDVRDILNLKIKRRESFRPFAPSVLEEKASEWFTKTHPAPFMLKVYPIKQEKRGLVPAVTHVDGSGRLQTVSPQTNPRYYKLISEFDRQTGVPMLVNTSFNENEPIVNTPAEALNCFLRTKMDRLVMGDIVITRPSPAA